MGFEPTVSWATTRCLNHSATLTLHYRYSTTKGLFGQVIAREKIRLGKSVRCSRCTGFQAILSPIVDDRFLAEDFRSLAIGCLPSMPSSMPQRIAPCNGPRILSADGLPLLQA